jgi:hypothetical protein
LLVGIGYNQAGFGIKSPLKGKFFETLEQLRKQLWDSIESLSAEAIASLIGYDFILETLFCTALQGIGIN